MKKDQKIGSILKSLSAVALTFGVMGVLSAASVYADASEDLNTSFSDWTPATSDATSTVRLDAEVALKAAFPSDSVARYSTSALFSNKVSIDNVDHTYSFRNGDSQSSPYYMVDGSGTTSTISGDAKYYTKTTPSGDLDLARVTTSSDGMQVAEKLILTQDNRSIDHEVTVRNGTTSAKEDVTFGTLLDTMLDDNDQIPIISDGRNGIYMENSDLRLYCSPTSDNLMVNAGHYVRAYGGTMSDSVSAEGKALGTQLVSEGDSAVQYQLKNAVDLPVGETVSYQYSEELYGQHQLTWADGTPNGWSTFSGSDLHLVDDPEQALFGDYSFYSPNDEAIYKEFTDLEPGKYRVTVYAKGENDSTLPVKVSLKTDPSSPNSRTLLLANPLSSGKKVQKGYYRVSANVTITADETDSPIIVVENYNGGYIAGISITPITE